MLFAYRYKLNLPVVQVYKLNQWLHLLRLQLKDRLWEGMIAVCGQNQLVLLKTTRRNLPPVSVSLCPRVSLNQLFMTTPVIACSVSKGALSGDSWTYG